MRFEVWAYGLDESGNEIESQVNSSVHDSNADQVSLPSFWVRDLPQRTGWSVNNIVHVKRFAVRAVSNEDGSVLDKQDFMRDSR